MASTMDFRGNPQWEAPRAQHPIGQEILAQPLFSGIGESGNKSTTILILSRLKANAIINGLFAPCQHDSRSGSGNNNCF